MEVDLLQKVKTPGSARSGSSFLLLVLLVGFTFSVPESLEVQKKNPKREATTRTRAASAVKLLKESPRSSRGLTEHFV